MKPLVSAIITTKNEERNIENCLQSIKNQTYPQEKIEIIVVDNHSSDSTGKIAKKFTDKVCNKAPGRSAFRREGHSRNNRAFVGFLAEERLTLRWPICQGT